MGIDAEFLGGVPDDLGGGAAVFGEVADAGRGVIWGASAGDAGVEEVLDVGDGHGVVVGEDSVVDDVAGAEEGEVEAGGGCCGMVSGEEHREADGERGEDGADGD